MKNRGIALFVLLGCVVMGNAQEQTAFQDFITEVFEKKLSHINSYDDVAPLMRSFSEDYHWVNVEIGIDGKVSTPELKNKEDFSSQIKYLASRPALSLTWEIVEYHELSKREDSRIASLKVKVSIIANGTLVTSGYNIIKVVAEKNPEHYAIKYMDILQVASQSELGPCYVKLTRIDNANFDADIAYPDGNEYEHYLTKIKMIPAEPFKAFRIDDVEQHYYWNPITKDVTLNKKGRKVGNARTADNVIIIAISNEAKKRCTSMIRTYKTK